MRRKSRRENISDAVHQSICEYYQSDGVGRCLHYAAVGSVIATKMLRREHSIIGGDLVIRCDSQSSDFYGIDSSLPEQFHCWIAADGALIDLSSRHYRTMYDRAKVDDLSWTIGEPPEFIWGNLPKWLWLIGRPWTTRAAEQFVADNHSEFNDLVRLAMKNLQESGRI